MSAFEPREIHQLAELTTMLEDAHAIFAKDGHTAGFNYLNSVKFNTGSAAPDDPLSPEYRAYMLELYKAISGKDAYEPLKFEKANLSFHDAIKFPWPFSSRDAGLVGSYFMGVSHLARVAGVYGCKSIFEYGTGWGHTAMMMARSGINVTACDIEPVFLDRLTATTAFENLPLTTFEGQFGETPEGATYDAFMFFECFHHCFDFIEVIPKMKEKLNTGGHIFLGGEPMLKNDDVPWGLRTDGHALWAIRTHGWMELGFREDFLIDIFANNGFTVTGHPCPAAGDAGFIYGFHLTE